MLTSLHLFEHRFFKALNSFTAPTDKNAGPGSFYNNV